MNIFTKALLGVFLVVSSHVFSAAGAGGAAPKLFSFINADTPAAEIQAHIEAGIPVNNPDERKNWSYSALAKAAQVGNVPVVELLLARGADLEGKFFLAPALWHAAAKNHVDVARILLGTDVDIDPLGGAGNHDYITPLAVALQRGHKAMAQLLLECGADYRKVRPFRGRNIVELAAWNGQELVALVQENIARKIDPATATPEEEALHSHPPYRLGNGLPEACLEHTPEGFGKKLAAELLTLAQPNNFERGAIPDLSPLHAQSYDIFINAILPGPAGLAHFLTPIAVGLPDGDEIRWIFDLAEYLHAVIPLYHRAPWEPYPRSGSLGGSYRTFLLDHFNATRTAYVEATAGIIFAAASRQKHEWILALLDRTIVAIQAADEDHITATVIHKIH